MIGTLDELKQYVSKYGHDPDELVPSNGYTFNLKSGGGILIWLPEFVPMDSTAHASLAHEITHAANFIFEHRDIHYWNECTETLAFYVEYLTKEFLEKLFKENE